MKKALSLLTMIISGTFLFSACSGKNNDVIEEVKLLEEHVLNNSLFNGDYKVHFNMYVKEKLDTVIDQNGFKEVTIVKDDNSYYREYREQENIKGNDLIIEENTGSEKLYYQFSGVDNSYSTYKVNNEKDHFVEMKKMKGEIEYFDNLFIYTADSYIPKLLNTCSKENTKTSCNVQRKGLINKKTIFTFRDPDNNNLMMEYVFYKGKIQSLKRTYIVNKIKYFLEAEFDYSNQKIDIPNFKDCLKEA